MRLLSLRCSTALALLLICAGCVAGPRLGKDEGREAIVWQHDSLTAPAAPAPVVPKNAAVERQLLDQLQQAEQKGTEDLALASTLYNLAIIRRQEGALTEAEQLYSRALAIHERQQGPEHPDIAMVLNNLAAVEAAQGNYDAAQPLLERALRIRQTALGSENSLTAQSLNNLALLYAARGDAAAAEPLYQRAVAALDRPDAPHTDELRRVLENYAALLQDAGRDAEAEKLAARARVLNAGGTSPATP